MSPSLGRITRRAAAALATTALLFGVATAPAQAVTPNPIEQSSEPIAELSSHLPQQVREAIYLMIALPIMTSSLLSSMIGIPQCGLHDTRAC